MFHRLHATKRLRPFQGLLTVLFAGLGLSAAPIPGLFPTGVDNSGKLLAAGAVDPHYKLVASVDPANPGPNAEVVLPGFPIPPWLANGPSSGWIAPKANQSGGNEPGDYVYEIRFDLSGLDPSTAVLAGVWSSDNGGVDIRLNGVSTGVSFEGDFSRFSDPFTLKSGFIAGVNTLQFVINNGAGGINPTGFRAEIAGTADPAPLNSPPNLKQELADLALPPGSNGELRVSVFGSLPMTYVWQHDGRVVESINGPALPILNAADKDIGSYLVIVSNAYGAVTSRLASVEIALPTPQQLNYEGPGPSSRRTGIAITEIHYHPIEESAEPGTGAAHEFIELYNSNPFFEDISGWRLTGEIHFEFPVGTRLEGLQRLVISPDPERLKIKYGITNVIGPWTGQLANGGGRVRLRKPSGAVVLEVNYTDSEPWPLAADGAGHSLVLVRPSYGEDAPQAWAASAEIHGSPGLPDPVPTRALEHIVFNEVLAYSTAPDLDFVELRNNSALTVDVSGCWLSDTPILNRFQIPQGTKVPGGGVLALTSVQLGFAMNASGETLYLRVPDGGRVIDALRFPAQAVGRSWGRSPDGQAGFRELQSPTPNTTNASPSQPAVILSELFYHPPQGRDADEFVELHNRSAQTVDVSGWKFTQGIEFTFEPGTQMPPGAYWVVAQNRTNLLASHTDLDAATIVGEFRGSLSDSGERLTLSKPEVQVRVDEVSGKRTTNHWMVIENEVSYGDGGKWGKWADGGGSSLELVDTHAENTLAANWADSDESGKASWQSFERLNTFAYQHPGVSQVEQLQVLLLNAGEAQLDDVEFVFSGQNRVRNGTFASGRTGWTGQGTHRLTFGETVNGNGVLHLVASDRGDHVANRVRSSFTSALPASGSATLRAKARWIRGHPEVLFRVRGSSFEMVATLEIPKNLGTPGKPNSRAVPNAAPAITAVEHRPVLPAAKQPVQVTARIADVDGIGRVDLVYRLDPSAVTQTLPMVDDGTQGDVLSGDGIYTATLPGQAANALVAYRVRATDAHVSSAATRTYPGEASTAECLVRFGDTVPANAFGTYRLWLTASAINTWSGRERMSNEDITGTFVYGTNRVIQAMGAHFSGSSYTSPSYNSPVGSLCGYDFNYPEDEPFLGETHTTLDWPIRDNTAQREQLMFWFLEQYGLPNMYRRYVQLFVNGTRRGSIYEDIQQPSSETVTEFFPDDDQGSLWKTDCWNEFDDAGNRIDPCVLNTLQKFPATGEKNIGRYRWNWRPRAVRGSANDFSDLFTLVDAANATLNYQDAVEAVVDVENWTRTFAMNDLASFWDAFGNSNGKNTFLYKPRSDGWKLYSWDFDVGLGVFNDPTNAGLFDANDPVVTRMMRNPTWLRLYWEALQEGMDGFFQSTRFSPILDAKYSAFRAANISLSSPNEIKTWISQRRSFLQTQLNQVRSPFAITLNNGQDFTTTESTLLLTGKAPVTTRSLRINGLERRVNWTTVSNWTVALALQNGENAIEVQGYNRFGAALPAAVDSITIRLEGTPGAPPPIRINEWMASNRATLADPADGQFDDWFELYNAGDVAVNLSGFTLTDNTNAPAQSVIPSGFTLAPRSHLLVWADNQPEQTQAGTALHVNFRLGAGGDTLALYDNTARLLDFVSFGPQIIDVSGGRYPDGAMGFDWNFSTPSPAGSNAHPELPPGHLRFLEIVANADGQVELRWRTAPGKRYLVRFGSLDGGVWTWTHGVERTATSDSMNTVDPSPPAEGVRFYQVVEVP